jgi:hypothetical protein
VQQSILLAHLGAAEHAPHGTVEQRDAVVGQARDGVEHARDHRREASIRSRRGADAYGIGRGWRGGARATAPADAGP